MTNLSNPEQPITAEAVKATALNLLARREHSRLELHHKLTRRGYPSEIVAAVLEHLLAEDLLNESRYAEMYANSRFDKGYGPLRIRGELRERGIEDSVIAAILGDLDDFWMRKLTQLQYKRFSGILPGDAVNRARQIRFLRHRGFTLEQINQLFQAL